MLRRAEPRSRTSWCQSFRAKREIRSFRHIADQRVAPFCGGAPCACTIRPYQPKGFVDRPITIPPGAKLALSAEAGAPEGMEDSYAFVMNVARLVGGTGFALGAGYELRRANTEESAVIKETLQRGHGTAKNDAVGVAGYSPGGSVEPLEEAEWRYHVISFRGSNQGLLEIEGD
jgi:hypothetical protein